jgi:hypothetical protein
MIRLRIIISADAIAFDTRRSPRRCRQRRAAAICFTRPLLLLMPLMIIFIIDIIIY